MCQVLGYQVRTLHRVRVVHITLDGLAPGEWKPLTGEERERLFRAVGRGSSQGDTRGRVTNEDTEQIRQ
jgi:16S rRNA U516 pseudouridylate synthase RsuA-like enzyme